MHSNGHYQQVHLIDGSAQDQGADHLWHTSIIGDCDLDLDPSHQVLFIFRSKTRNKISEWILDRFTRSNFVLIVVIYLFPMNLRTCKGSAEMKQLVVPPLLQDWSKIRNWITQPIIATFTRSKVVIKGVIHSFPTHPRTPRLAQRKWRNQMISYTSPPVWLIKNSELNYSTNTGHIH